jgi:hypothetical protein
VEASKSLGRWLSTSFPRPTTPDLTPLSTLPEPILPRVSMSPTSPVSQASLPSPGGFAAAGVTPPQRQGVQNGTPAVKRIATPRQGILKRGHTQPSEAQLPLPQLVTQWPTPHAPTSDRLKATKSLSDLNAAGAHVNSPALPSRAPPLPPLPPLPPGLRSELQSPLSEPGSTRVSPTAVWLNHFLLESPPAEPAAALFARDIAAAGLLGGMAAGPRAAAGAPPYGSPVAAAASPYQAMMRLLAGLQRWVQKGDPGLRDQYIAAATRCVDAWTLQSTELDLCCLSLETLPAEIGALSQLRTLNLSQNQLRFLPPEMARLRFLEELDLTHNLLVYLPEFLRAMQGVDVYRDANVEWRHTGYGDAS